MDTTTSEKKRQLNFWDCLGVGINGIIGTGIFLLPAGILVVSGKYSPLSWLLLGVICILVALCFAEASGHTERSGGPYRYACDVFGLPIGFIVGWVTLASTVLGYAAVASEFGGAIWETFFAVSNTWAKFSLSISLVVFLCIINLIGVKIGSRASFVISMVKIVTLLLFVVVGIFFVKKALLNPELSTQTVAQLRKETWLPSFMPLVGLLIFSGASRGLFAITGFEYVPVPAGEVINPKKNIPLAMVFSIVGILVLYMFIQVVVTGTISDVLLKGDQAAFNNPVVESVRTFMTQWKGVFAGELGAKLTNFAKAISIFGFCAGSALVGPRYFEVFAEDRFLPEKLMQRSSKRNVPVYAIVTLALLVIFFMTWMQLVSPTDQASLTSVMPQTIFTKLSNLSNIAVLIQFVSTCLSIMVLHAKKQFAKDGFTLGRLGYIIPFFAIMGCLLMLGTFKPKDGIYALIIIGVGIVFGFLHRVLFSKKSE